MTIIRLLSKMILSEVYKYLGTYNIKYLKKKCYLDFQSSAILKLSLHISLQLFVCIKRVSDGHLCSITTLY